MVYGNLLTLQTDLTALVNSYHSINDEHNVFGLINNHFLPLVVNRVANNGFKPFEMLFKASRCDDVDLVKSFAGELNTKLGVMVMIQTCTHRCGDFPVVCVQNIGSSFFSVPQLPNICGSDNVTCKLEMMPQGHCLEYNYDYENGFSISEILNKTSAEC